MYEVLIIEYLLRQYWKLKYWSFLPSNISDVDCKGIILNVVSSGLIRINWLKLHESRFQLRLKDFLDDLSCPNMTNLHLEGDRALPPSDLQAEAKGMSWWRTVGGEWVQRCLHHRCSESMSVTQHRCNHIGSHGCKAGLWNKLFS